MSTLAAETIEQLLPRLFQQALDEKVNERPWPSSRRLLEPGEGTWVYCLEVTRKGQKIYFQLGLSQDARRVWAVADWMMSTLMTEYSCPSSWRLLYQNQEAMQSWENVSDIAKRLIGV